MNGKRTWGPHNGGLGRSRARAPKKEMMTDRERKLAHSLLGGMSRTAAFRKSGYPTMSGSDADSILNRPHFVRYMAAARLRQVERLDYSIENLCARLEHVYFEALALGQTGSAVQAVLGIAKMMGHLADRTEVEMHIISKPMRETTEAINLSPEEWQRQFAPKRIN
jgi:hypothetical protein